MKMRKVKVFLLSCLAFLGVAFGGVLLGATDVIKSNAATLASMEYGTDGASVRIFKHTTETRFGELSAKDRGIRFHVQMGSGYAWDSELLDQTQTNENGSYVMAEGYKTYTLVIPTRLLTGELTLDTPKAMAIDTTEYWYLDQDENLEAVAYVYNIPDGYYTDEFTYRGVICKVDETEAVTDARYTGEEVRSVSFVAKAAYTDTVAGNVSWGTDGEYNETAKKALLKLIPQYEITYIVNGAQQSEAETVLWGDTPQNAPTGVHNSWFDEAAGEKVDVSKAMLYGANKQIALTATSAETFVLTGIAAEADFVVGDNTYHGAKVYATLHADAFAEKTEMNIKAVNVAHLRGGEVVNDGFTIDGVWTMKDSNGTMRLFFAFDSSKLENGDSILIQGDSVFYANGVMYELTEDYYIDFTRMNAAEDYGMFLGYLYNSDIVSLTNCEEDSSGQGGQPDEYTLRVEFYEDVMVNGEFTFEFGPNTDQTKYPYPVYIRCGEDKTKMIPVSGGVYYWNEGDHKILELIGAGEYENKVFGWHTGDELIGAPGTIVKQNGGYYIFEDEMYGYFLPNGDKNNWDTALGEWVVGNGIGDYTASEFSVWGSVAEITDYGVQEYEMRLTTTNHWFPNNAKVSILTTEKMLKTAPYAIYRTAVDGTVTEVTKLRYHGQANPSGGYYQILGLCGIGDYGVGDIVTIAAGTRFWLGAEYYTVTEEISYYFTGSEWVQNYDESTMGELSSANFETRAHNEGDGEVRMYFSAPLAGYTEENGGGFNDLKIGTGSITLNGTPFAYVRYQRWDEGSTWLAMGGNGMSGKIAFGDKVVIEAGTTIWSADKVVYRFTERVEWIYTDPTVVGDQGKSLGIWSRVLGGVSVSVTATNAAISGSGTFAVGGTYTFTATADEGYLISSVKVSGVEKELTANNVYSFTVEQANGIVVEAVKGDAVTFSVAEGIIVDGGNVVSGTIKTIAHGDSFTFAVAAQDGYKVASVSGATDNGDGTYTVTPTGNMTVSITAEKLYKVTYSFDSESVSLIANVASGAWVENGTEVTLTVSAKDGYTLLGVTNATKVNATTYTATVNGADLNVTISALKNSEFTDITDYLAMEDRSSWGLKDHPNGDKEVYVALLDMGITNDGGNHYFNTTVNGTWYVGNNDIIGVNGGVDIMEYIYVNGVSARKLITDNENGVRAANGCNCWLSNPAAYPVYVESTNGSGLMMRFSKTVFGPNFTVTIKAGFRITSAARGLVAVTKDINFTYANGAIVKDIEIGTEEVNTVGVTFRCDNGVLINDGAIASNATERVEIGVPFTFQVSAREGYKITGVSGATENGNGTYTVTPTEDVTVTVHVEKLYKVTYTGDVTVNGNVENGAWVDDGTVVEFTPTANDGYTIIEVKNVEKLNPTTYRTAVNGANLTIEIVTLANGTFVNINDRLAMEDRAWGAHTGEVYVALLDMGITNDGGNHYLNTLVNDTWYVGNDAIIEANGGVDIMKYIYVNGVSARKLITDNANGVRTGNDCNGDGVLGKNEQTGESDCWLSNPAAYPVYVESTNGSGLMMRFSKAVFGTSFTVTIKAGFRITNANGDLVALTKDYDFIYTVNDEGNGTITKQDYWKTVALKTLKANIGTYVDNKLSYTADADTLNSKKNCSQVTLSAELFETLQYYGYSTISFDMTVRANRTTTSFYEWQILKGEEQIFFTDSNKNYDKTVSTSASEAVTYSVYYRETSASAWKLDDSIWTISNIDIS